MKLGLIGTGAIGQAIASQVVRAGHELVLANSRGPSTLSDLVRKLGPHASAGTRQQAAAAGVVFVAVPWSRLPAALADLPAWNGRILVDANNAIEAPAFRAADLGGRRSSDVTAELAPGARVVKAFNTLPPPILGADPHVGGGRRVLFVSGDDAAARATVRGIIDQIGFAPIDLGRLDAGGRLQEFPGGPLAGLDLVEL